MYLYKIFQACVPLYHHNLEAIALTLQSKKTITHCWPSNLTPPLETSLRGPYFRALSFCLCVSHSVSGTTFLIFFTPLMTMLLSSFGLQFFLGPLFIWILAIHGFGTGIYVIEYFSVRSFLFFFFFRKKFTKRHIISFKNENISLVLTKI